MRIAIDTNRYVDLRNGVTETIRLLERAELIALPFIVIGELRAGFLLGNRREENESALRRFMRRSQILFADDRTTHIYATLFRQLRKQGTPIPLPDVWIAALVIQHNLTLHARDRHFDHLPQIARI
jgi:tRNA(fMet)-specific endonuclease VapC